MKKLLISLGAVVAIILIAGFLAWNYIVTTPAYSFFQIYSAIKAKDYNSFTKYADVDSIVTSVVNKVMDKAQADMEKTSDQSGLGDWGKSFGEGLIAMMKPAIISQAKAAIKKGVESGVLLNADKNAKNASLLVLLSKTKVTKDGENVDVTYIGDDKKPVTFKMRQTKDKYWQIYDMDLDLSGVPNSNTSSDITSNTQRAKFGQRVSLGSGWFLTVLEPTDYTFGSYTPQDGNKLIALEATYENTTNTADTYSISNVKIKDTQNHEYSPMYVGGKDPSLDGSTLEAQGKVDGFLTFEVPQSTQVQSVIYSNGDVTIVFNK